MVIGFWNRILCGVTATVCSHSGHILVAEWAECGINGMYAVCMACAQLPELEDQVLNSANLT